MALVDETMHMRFVSKLGVVAVIAVVGVGAADLRGQGGGHLSWGPNLVVNSSFEDGFSAWTATLGAREESGEPEVRSQVAIDSEVSHSGLAGLRLNGTSDTTLWLAVQSDPVAVRENSQYVLVAWAKSDAVVRDLGQYLNANAYIQFLGSDGAIVKLGQSPVRTTPRVLGTSDWRELQRVVKAPAGAVAAQVGVALTCTGTIWFDQVELHEVTNVVWHKTETDRFIFHAEGGAEPPEPIVKSNESYLRSIERILEIEPGAKFPYFRYVSADRLGELTGKHGKGHYSGREIHAIRWDDRSAYTGVLMSAIGESTQFLGNGLATYCAVALQGRNTHEDAKKMLDDGILPSVVELNRSEVIRNYPSPLFQPLATSFVGYLVEQYGMEKFKRLFSFKTAELAETTLDEVVYKEYQRTIEQLESEWTEFLKAL